MELAAGGLAGVGAIPRSSSSSLHCRFQRSKGATLEDSDWFQAWIWMASSKFGRSVMSSRSSRFFAAWPISLLAGSLPARSTFAEPMSTTSSSWTLPVLCFLYFFFRRLGLGPPALALAGLDPAHAEGAFQARRCEE